MARMWHWVGQVLAGLAAGVVGAYTVVPRINARIKKAGVVLDDRREFHRRIILVLTLCQSITQLADVDVTRTVAERLRAERARLRRQLEEHVLWLADNMPWYAMSYLEPIRTAAITYTSCARGLLLSDRTETEQARRLLDLTTPVHALFVARRWPKPPNVPALLDEIQRKADALGPDTPPTPAPGPAAALPTAREPDSAERPPSAAGREGSAGGTHQQV